MDTTSRYASLISLPLAGVVAYLPWFAMEGYYALAFVPGLIVLFALALSWLWYSQARLGKPLAVASCGLIVMYGTLLSTNYVNAHRASRAAEEEAARALAGLQGRRLIAGVPSPENSGSFAAGLRGYAQATGVSDIPQGVDLACADASRNVLERAPDVIVMFSTLCEPDTTPHVTPARTIRQSYVTRDWKNLARSRRDVSVHIWAPATPTDGIAEK